VIGAATCSQRRVGALSRQAGGLPIYLMPRGIGAQFRERVVELDWWRPCVRDCLRGPVEFTRTPAQD
jgi:hypothetical protein